MRRILRLLLVAVRSLPKKLFAPHCPYGWWGGFFFVNYVRNYVQQCLSGHKKCPRLGLFRLVRGYIVPKVGLEPTLLRTAF